jgi:hypothetical protein
MLFKAMMLSREINCVTEMIVDDIYRQNDYCLSNYNTDFDIGTTLAETCFKCLKNTKI